MNKSFCLPAAGNDNTNGNLGNINFTRKDRKSYVAVVTLSTKDNRKLSKLLSKGIIGINIKQKVRKK